MFQVQPVRSRELQAQIADVLYCEYFSDTYAFFAGELAEDNTTITSLIGMCQFTYTPEKSVIQSIAYPAACEKDEAVIIMVRTVMNFIYRAGIPFIAVKDGAASEEFIHSLGFRKHDGEWLIDLKKFYRSPCHFKPDEENA
ncbi:MAG: hypothetical protein IJ497_10305 [Clostridia bacterium]|nr:hypothetical protein [Clostridia bacterium]MBQ8512997.1 hypothetical protein [Clostridia bacterium]